MKFSFTLPSFLTKKKHVEAAVVDPLAREEHRHDREQFQRLLHSFKANRIDERLAVLDVFLGFEYHVSLAELEHAIREQHPEIVDRAFINETMNMFCQYGFAQQLDFDSQATLYEHRHLGRHHDHLICTKCGVIQEFSNDALERLQLSVAQNFMFHALQHKTEIYGLCSKCMATRSPALPLHLAAVGERVEIVEIRGGRELVTRLTEMGLVVGESLEVVSNNPSGPFVVVVNDCRLALGSGVSQKILVRHACRYDRGSDEGSHS